MTTEAPPDTVAQPLRKVQLIRTWVTTAPYRRFIREIIGYAQRRQSSYVCFANVHMLMEAHRNPDFNQVVNQAELVAPDGRPLSVLMRWQFGLQQDRVCGMDLLPDLLRSAAEQSLSVYFYGSTQANLDIIEQRLKHEYPTLHIAGLESPPFRPLSAEEDQDAVDRINNSGAHLVFVSLGCPKQERWMADHRGRVHACMLGLGQAFLTFAGTEKRLPRWAHDYALEWAYRLYLEPGRLWKRYLVGNTWFLYNALIRVIRTRVRTVR
ncbi:MAG: WecB/TagA/CpsF family glycosyltransferase [Tunicatimonas sp.]